MDLFVVSDNESVQFYYNSAQTVTAIMMTYSGDLSGPDADGYVWRGRRTECRGRHF